MYLVHLFLVSLESECIYKVLRIKSTKTSVKGIENKYNFVALIDLPAMWNIYQVKYLSQLNWDRWKFYSNQFCGRKSQILCPYSGIFLGGRETILTWNQNWKNDCSYICNSLIQVLILLFAERVTWNDLLVSHIFI